VFPAAVPIVHAVPSHANVNAPAGGTDCLYSSRRGFHWRLPEYHPRHPGTKPYPAGLPPTGYPYASHRGLRWRLLEYRRSRPLPRRRPPRRPPMLWHRPAETPPDSRVICWTGQAMSLAAQPRGVAATARGYDDRQCHFGKGRREQPVGQPFAQYTKPGFGRPEELPALRNRLTFAVMRRLRRRPVRSRGICGDRVELWKHP
jgi:hypothetical protein